MIDVKKLGVLLPTRQRVTEATTAQEVLELASYIESLGVGSLWVGDSLFARPRLDPLAMLAALAHVTQTCTIGTSILVAPMWSPLLLARSVATIDALAEGRLVLGVGAGPGHGQAMKEFAALGVPFEGRLSRTIEVLAACRAVWSGQAAEHKGEHWKFRNVTMTPRPTRQGGPPVLLGGSGPKTREAAGEYFDGWMPIVNSAAKITAGNADVAAAAASAGRRGGPTIGYLCVCIDPDPRRAAQLLQKSMEEYYCAPWSVIGGLQDYAAGPALVVREAIEAYYTAGAEEMIIRFSGGDPRRQLEALLS